MVLLKDNSLIQKEFQYNMEKNKMPALCFRICGLVLAGAAALAAQPATVFSTVRVDRSTGRLVRAKLPSPTTPAALPQTTPAVEEIVNRSAADHGVDPLLVKSVIAAESNFNPNAVSRKGAMGLMQLMPATARQLGVSNAFDVQQNIEAGVRYLRYLKTRFSDERLVLAAYNAGEGAVKKHGWIPPYPETIDYVHKVERNYAAARRQQQQSAPVEASKPQPKVQQVVDAEGRIHIQISGT
jgi:soluble lytic murein transglycosylase-like protein